MKDTDKRPEAQPEDDPGAVRAEMLQVTLFGRPLGRKVYVDEILDAMSSWCPEMTSRKAKRQAGKNRRRARLRAARGKS